MKKQKIRVAVIGVNGRMGKNLCKFIYKSKNIFLSSALVTDSKFPFIGKDLGNVINLHNTGINISNNVENVIHDFDILIDFTHPNTLNYYLNACQRHSKCLIIGTTGFTDEVFQKIKKVSKKMKIIMSSNFSVGINIILNYIKNIVKFINYSTDIDILETHHRNKIDVPSGTALSIGKKVADSMNWNFKKCFFYLKKGINKIRKKNIINFSSIRSGNVIGEHSLILRNSLEEIEIKHKSLNRSVFSYGVIQAINWIMKQNKNGLYNMEDVLNLSNR